MLNSDSSKEAHTFRATTSPSSRLNPTIPFHCCPLLPIVAFQRAYSPLYHLRFGQQRIFTFFFFSSPYPLSIHHLIRRPAPQSLSSVAATRANLSRVPCRPFRVINKSNSSGDPHWRAQLALLHFICSNLCHPQSLLQTKRSLSLSSALIDIGPA